MSILQRRCRLYESNDLTCREKEIVKLICVDGTFSIKEIAEALIIAPATVRTHIETIYLKLNVHSKAELIYRYYTNNLKNCVKI